MTRTRALLAAAALLSLVVTALTAPARADAPEPAVERGAPGTWTKISTGTSGITYRSSLQRTADGVLHVVYPKTDGGDDATYGHTAIDADGSIARQNNVLVPGWASVDPTPALVRDGDGLRVVFGGLRSTDPGYWSDGRMYTATAGADGAAWDVPMAAVGQSHSAYGSYGTSAVALADGTPVAAFPLNSELTWHVGTGEAVPDQSLTFDDCCLYYTAMADDDGDVWLAWYANGDTPATEGIFVKQILPAVGPTLKAPQSSVGSDSVAPMGGIALTARTGGGVFAAYCVGYPTCDHVGLWKVGTDTVRKVPSTTYAADIALSPGPSGRLWIAWSDNIPRIRAVRTNVAGTGLGAIRNVKMPANQDGVYDVAIDGTTGRGDIVINTGGGFWHTQVAPGLSVDASPATWKRGKKQKVTFDVSDAGDPVAGATVKVGDASCTTGGDGSCAITFAASKKKASIAAKATLSGYGAGSVRLKIA